MSRILLLRRTTAILCLFLAGCQAAVQEKGNILETDRMQEIRTGVTTRSRVQELLGHPTLVNSFRPDRWIYVQDRRYKDQRNTSRLIIDFDSRGVVRNVERNFDKEVLDPRESPDSRTESLWTHMKPWGGRELPKAEGDVDPLDTRSWWQKVLLIHPEKDQPEPAKEEKGADSATWRRHLGTGQSSASSGSVQEEGTAPASLPTWMGKAP
ncbi:MAG: outer membrane protein assembly factor BamE [Magnetococcales bacterium]|nr:outer membrane protein assembly factor BamE [Magnetococcales bacterium]